MRILSLIGSISLVAIACGVETSGVPTSDAGSEFDSSPNVDGAVADATSPSDGNLPVGDAGNTWTWIPMPNTACGNGTPSGYALNLVPNSKKLLVVVQGGGACWDTTSCYVLNAATHIDDTMTDKLIQGEVAQIDSYGVTNRTDGPFKDASFIYIPYCTADLHVGDAIGSYDPLNAQHKVHHAGGTNMAAYVEKFAKDFPSLNQLWLTGISAGGYGAILNFDRFAKAFPAAHVDLLADSSPVTQPDASRWAIWQAAWKAQLPANCTDCATRMPAVMETLQARYTDRRLGLLAFEDDGVITLFFSYALGEMKTQLNSLLAAQYNFPNTKYFVLPGTTHVMLSQYNSAIGAGGVPLKTWVKQWASGDAAWANVH